MIKNGVVLGRFQPFHKGHLNYIKLALKKSRNLIIGITTPGKIPGKYEPQNKERFGKENNPFNFSERRKMIKETLIEEKIDLKKIRFIHFKPSEMESWFKKVPKNAVYFLILRAGDRNQEMEMKSQGLKVEVLKEINDDKFKGLNIRSLFKINSAWEELVPDAVVRFLKQKSVKKNQK